MKRFLSKNGIWLLAGVAVVVVVLCIISACLLYTSDAADE